MATVLSVWGSANVYSLIQSIHAGSTRAGFFACLLILCFAGGTPTALADEEAETESKLNTVKARIKALGQRILADQERKSDNLKELKQAETRINQLSRSLRQVNKELKQSQHKLTSLEGERNELEAQRREQQSALGEDIRAAYMQGRQEYLKLLLNQENPEKLARMLRYYDYFHRSRAERIDDFSTTLDKLDQVSQKIDQEVDRLEDIRTNLTRKRDDLKNAQAERKKVIARLEQSLQGSDQKLKHLQEDEKELQALLDAVRQTLDDLPPDIGKQPFQHQRGRLPWPAKGRVVHNFGSRRMEGRLTWKGIFINASPGSQVTAVHHGRVVFADWLRGKGMLIVVDHGDGYLSLYGHNEALLKEAGDWVESGEVIALVGKSGGLEESGLYFEIRESGKPLNPKRWIARR